jgi:hypothetical protein
MPQIGQTITVDLPDERTRAEVVQVVSDSALLVKLTQFTTAAKSHPYHKGDVVAVQLRKDGMNQQAWIAIDERATAPRPETIASLAEADDTETEEPEDAVDAPALPKAQPSPKPATVPKGGGTGKRHTAERGA